MNDSQSKVKKYMDGQIHELKRGRDNLRDREDQPGSLGNLYNGMLGHAVEFEITHMEHLRDDLIDLLN